MSDSRSSARGTTWVVEAGDDGTRLDKFLAAPDRLGSRSRATSALERRKVFVEDEEASVIDAARRLTVGTRIRYWADRPGSARRPPPTGTGDLGIVFEDESIIVLNKPAGLLSVPLDTTGASSVVDQVTEYLRRRGGKAPFVVHRIDRDTSGLVLFAKDPRARDVLKAQFRRREPDRVYWAVVYGRPEPSEGRWEDRLVWDETALIQKETHPRDPKGAEAVSHYRVLETFRTTSLIEVRLHTGKRNQIRIQARLRGHTLVGEQRYVFGPASLRPIAFPRQALHAYRLAVVHPVTGQPLQFEAPLAKDIEGLLEMLRADARRGGRGAPRGADGDVGEDGGRR